MPEGFKSKEPELLPNGCDRENGLESQLFSDGLFSFSVYIADKDEHSLKGRRKEAKDAEPCTA
ncbi:MucB/RseB C-terminal domain-containing protein [Vibrio chagasii]|nr:MucB/RseB C-terminal domain-containing protein [Vibrio chagasii]